MSAATRAVIRVATPTQRRFESLSAAASTLGASTPV